MILNETLLAEKKSIRVLENSHIKDLTKEFVSFANAKGGEIYIGIEDDADTPPLNQHIENYLLTQFSKRINELTINVNFNCKNLTASNGSDYLECSISPCSSNPASTTDGKYYIRDGDTTRP
jgi:ATP-dependent DNA helicase RecG